MQSCLIEEFSRKGRLPVRTVRYRQPVEPGRPVSVEVALDGYGVVHRYQYAPVFRYEDSMGLARTGGMYPRMYLWVD